MTLYLAVMDMGSQSLESLLSLCLLLALPLLEM